MMRIESCLATVDDSDSNDGENWTMWMAMRKDEKEAVAAVDWRRDGRTDAYA